eukprot:jgi/Bigna1/139953/aug1.53_g14661
MEPEPPVAPSADASRAAAEDEDESKEKLLHIPFRELECALCLKSLFDPVTTPECGHTFCRACLSRAVREKPNCPLCRHPLCKMDPKCHPVNSLIVHLVSKYAPREYKLREEETTVRKAEKKTKYGIFFAHFLRFVIMTGPDEGVGCFVKIESSRSTADGRFYIDGKATHRCNVTNISYEEGEFGLQVGEAKIAEDRLLASSSSSSSPSSPSSSSLSSSSQPPQSSAPSSAPPSIQSPPEDSTDEKKRLDEIVNNVMQEVGRYQRAVGSVEYSRITRENGALYLELYNRINMD